MLRSLTSRRGRPGPPWGAGRPRRLDRFRQNGPDFRLGAVPFVWLERSLLFQCLSPQTGQRFLRFTLMVSNCMLSASMKSILPQSVEPMPAAIFRASVA